MAHVFWYYEEDLNSATHEWLKAETPSDLLEGKKARRDSDMQKRTKAALASIKGDCPAQP